MGARRVRRQQRQTDMAQSRRVNGALKTKERDRRDQRMLGFVQKGKLPYLPSVMSWLSTKLDKPSRLITQNEVDQLVSAAKSQAQPGPILPESLGLLLAEAGAFPGPREN